LRKEKVKKLSYIEQELKLRNELAPAFVERMDSSMVEYVYAHTINRKFFIVLLNNYITENLPQYFFFRKGIDLSDNIKDFTQILFDIRSSAIASIFPDNEREYLWKYFLLAFRHSFDSALIPHPEKFSSYYLYIAPSIARFLTAFKKNPKKWVTPRIRKEVARLFRQYNRFFLKWDNFSITGIELNMIVAARKSLPSVLVLKKFSIFRMYLINEVFRAEGKRIVYSQAYLIWVITRALEIYSLSNISAVKMSFTDSLFSLFEQHFLMLEISNILFRNGGCTIAGQANSEATLLKISLLERFFDCNHLELEYLCSFFLDFAFFNKIASLKSNLLPLTGNDRNCLGINYLRILKLSLSTLNGISLVEETPLFQEKQIFKLYYSFFRDYLYFEEDVFYKFLPELYFHDRRENKKLKKDYFFVNKTHRKLRIKAVFNQIVLKKQSLSSKKSRSFDFLRAIKNEMSLCASALSRNENQLSSNPNSFYVVNSYSKNFTRSFSTFSEKFIESAIGGTKEEPTVGATCKGVSFFKSVHLKPLSVSPPLRSRPVLVNFPYLSFNHDSFYKYVLKNSNSVLSAYDFYGFNKFLFRSKMAFLEVTDLKVITDCHVNKITSCLEIESVNYNVGMLPYLNSELTVLPDELLGRDEVVDDVSSIILSGDLYVLPSVTTFGYYEHFFEFVCSDGSHYHLRESKYFLLDTSLLYSDLNLVCYFLLAKFIWLTRNNSSRSLYTPLASARPARTVRKASYQVNFYIGALGFVESTYSYLSGCSFFYEYLILERTHVLNYNALVDHVYRFWSLYSAGRMQNLALFQYFSNSFVLYEKFFYSEMNAASYYNSVLIPESKVRPLSLQPSTFLEGVGKQNEKLIVDWYFKCKLASLMFLMEEVIPACNLQFVFFCTNISLAVNSAQFLLYAQQNYSVFIDLQENNENVIEATAHFVRVFELSSFLDPALDPVDQMDGQHFFGQKVFSLFLLVPVSSLLNSFYYTNFPKQALSLSYSIKRYYYIFKFWLFLLKTGLEDVSQHLYLKNSCRLGLPGAVDLSLQEKLKDLEFQKAVLKAKITRNKKKFLRLTRSKFLAFLDSNYGSVRIYRAVHHYENKYFYILGGLSGQKMFTQQSKFQEYLDVLFLINSNFVLELDTFGSLELDFLKMSQRIYYRLLIVFFLQSMDKYKRGFFKRSARSYYHFHFNDYVKPALFFNDLATMAVNKEASSIEYSILFFSSPDYRMIFNSLFFILNFSTLAAGNFNKFLMKILFLRDYLDVYPVVTLLFENNLKIRGQVESFLRNPPFFETHSGQFDFHSSTALFYVANVNITKELLFLFSLLQRKVKNFIRYRNFKTLFPEEKFIITLIKKKRLSPSRLLQLWRCLLQAKFFYMYEFLVAFIVSISSYLQLFLSDYTRSQSTTFFEESGTFDNIEFIEDDFKFNNLSIVSEDSGMPPFFKPPAKFSLLQVILFRYGLVLQDLRNLFYSLQLSEISLEKFKHLYSDVVVRGEFKELYYYYPFLQKLFFAIESLILYNYDKLYFQRTFFLTYAEYYNFNQYLEEVESYEMLTIFNYKELFLDRLDFLGVSPPEYGNMVLFAGTTESLKKLAYLRVNILDNFFLYKRFCGVGSSEFIRKVSAFIIYSSLNRVYFNKFIFVVYWD
jgi:hypothetical protein